MPGVLSTQDFERAAERLRCPLAAIRAVCEVESPRGGFNPDGEPVTLFEAHQFHRLTDGQFDARYPNLSGPKWDRMKYGKTWLEERKRFLAAGSLDYEAACMSTSWGRFQIMGFNYAVCGFRDISAFVFAMSNSEGDQLDAFCEYIEHRQLDDEMQRQDWKTFARIYNGPGYAQNAYDKKLDAAFRKWSLQ